MTASPAPLVVAIGAINQDVTLFVESLPAPGQEVSVRNLSRVPGGTAANVATTAARLLPASATAFIGALGDDAIADEQRAILRAEGILTDAVQLVPGVESGQAFILVDSHGQNVIASALGANAYMTAEHLRAPAVRGMIAGARVCAVTDPPLPIVAEVLDIAQAGGCSVSWDPGVLAAQGKEAVVPLARRVDTLLLNEEETAALLGRQTPRDAADYLRSEGWTNRVILKRGGQGALVIDLRHGQLIEVPPLPLEDLGMRSVSSVGAGDAFHGALAAREALGHDDADALLGAACAAGITVSQPGTRAAPAAADLESVLQAWRERGASVHSTALPSA